MIERSRGIERTTLLVAGSVGAGVHAGLAPEHLHEWLPLGIAFVASATLLAAAVVVLAVRPDDTRPAHALAVLLLGLVAAYAATRLTALPPLDPTREAPDPLGLATSAIEAGGALVGLRLTRPRLPFANPQGGTP
jgi:hypothetical protein